jgi:hypothetical protein
MRILDSNRYRIPAYAIVFIVVSSVTFFWLDSLDKGVNVYRHAPMSRETEVITERYKIKRLEDRIKDLKSGTFKQRMQGLGTGGPHLSAEMITREISTAEEELRQSRKRLARLLRE